MERLVWPEAAERARRPGVVHCASHWLCEPVSTSLRPPEDTLQVSSHLGGGHGWTMEGPGLGQSKEHGLIQLHFGDESKDSVQHIMSLSYMRWPPVALGSPYPTPCLPQASAL